MSPYLYREVRMRNHFAKQSVENWFSGVITLCPLTDRNLQQLKTCSAGCSDNNLLISVIFDRYRPELLEFKFDSGRSIESSTIAYARTLNKKYPCAAGRGSIYNTDKKLVAVDTGDNNEDAVAKPDKKNALSSKYQIREFIKDGFYSSACKHVFTTLYSEKIYYKFAEMLEKKSYFPEQGAYIVMAIAAYYSICCESCSTDNARYANIYERVNAWCKDTLSSNRLSCNMICDPYILNYITARIDVQGIGDTGAVIKIKDASDKEAEIISPDWINKNGSGYVIQSQSGKITLLFECINSGTIGIFLKSADVRDVNNKRIRFFIDYHSFAINDELIFDETKCQHHDNPYRFEKEVIEGEEIRVSVTWSYHDERVEKKDYEQREIELYSKLKQTYAEKSEINTKLQQTYKEKAERGVKIKELEKELSELKSSRSYRLGRALTTPARKLRWVRKKQ